jgi:glycosyltransferase involved in cell wall biosynthesis
MQGVRLAKSVAKSAAAKARHHGLYKIAVLVPCYNEQAAIAKVVKDFRTALPGAAIFVFDNNSTDKTAAVARAAGAEVFQEKHQGKGFVVRRMFTDVEADIYVLVDGDATYDAPSANAMITRLLADRLDMVVANRVDCEKAAYRAGHRTGNRMLTAFVASMFGPTFNDVLSGYRVFSRRFVKSFPLRSAGFEIETELTIHALELGLAVAEIDTPYLRAPTRVGFQAQHLARRHPDPTHHHKALSRGACLGVFHRHWHGARHCVDRLRNPGLRHLPTDRAGAAAADRDTLNRPDAAGVFVDRRRLGARHGDARPARDETARIPFPSRAG